jgi:hypothetical protein
MQPLDLGIIYASRTEMICNPMAWIIFQRTSTLWTHAVVFKNDKGDCWSAEPGGIKDRNISRYAGRQVKVIRPRFSFDRYKVTDYILLAQHLCEGYDYLALLGFLTGIKAFNDETRWYCAELAFWCWQDNGYLIANEEPAFIYPSDLLQNPMFEVIK